MPQKMVLCPVCKVGLKRVGSMTCVGCRPQSRRKQPNAFDVRLAKARKAGFEGADLVLATMSEDQWTDHVVEWARQGGWCGIHLRFSHLVGTKFAALRGVHLKAHHGHSDAFGLPDWLFWRPSELLWVELKIWGEQLRPDQERVVAAFREAGEDVVVWNPLDGPAARARLLGAPVMDPIMIEESGAMDWKRRSEEFVAARAGMRLPSGRRGRGR